ncbi:hypothetical protein C1I95_02210 [Micromonospora craterilacus]|uniref:Uncharacterized protein n=1 Tax=Micromonospora craterilacus TaxID=1655439 RepID=A0A2W2FGR5_9ACTN|nr:hypothetical protein [Micromonospora craterilacus]PZG23858.1 hypothetical protein C1I95_02210 [Micromonospora craterilacus]
MAAAASITDLFAACRLIMTADTCAVVVASSAAPGEPGTTSANLLDEMPPAARAVGLTHVLRIVAVTAPGGSDEVLYLRHPSRSRGGTAGPASRRQRARAAASTSRCSQPESQ